MTARDSVPHGSMNRFNAIGSRAVDPLSTDAIRRVLETIGWGSTVSDRLRIAAYYGLRIISGTLRRDHDFIGGMYPKYWLGDVAIASPIGRFACRARTIDFDIVDPNYEAVELGSFREWLLRFKTGNVVCLDVGAHIGKFSVYAGHILQDRGRILAFEPEPLNFAALQRNIALNKLANVQAFNVACGSRDGVQLLSRSTTNIGAHTLAERGGVAERIPVRVRTLDSLLGELGITSVDAMKLDVEYMEAEVLRGARTILESNPQVGVFFEETNSSGNAESVVFLQNLGFNVRRLAKNTYAAARPSQG